MATTDPPYDREDDDHPLVECPRCGEQAFDPDPLVLECRLCFYVPAQGEHW